MSKSNSFESYFGEFVIQAGGAVLAEAPGDQAGVMTADYYFEKQNVVTELKTLMEDSSAKMDSMMLDAIKEWEGNPLTIPVKIDANNLPYVDPDSIPEIIRKRWKDKLFQEIERNIKSANKQIAHTKERFNLPTARGVILVSNESNAYHNNPRSYREALGALLLKRTATGERKYPHIDGGVYFSKALPSRLEKMPFWSPFHIEEPNNTNAELQAFILELRTQWYAYIERTTGVTVRQHDTD